MVDSKTTDKLKLLIDVLKEGLNDIDSSDLRFIATHIKSFDLKWVEVGGGAGEIVVPDINIKFK